VTISGYVSPDILALGAGLSAAIIVIIIIILLLRPKK
jgi:hypothetical protein